MVVQTMLWKGARFVVGSMPIAYGSREMTPRMIPDLIDMEQELFELPQKVSHDRVQSLEAITEACVAGTCNI